MTERYYRRVRAECVTMGHEGCEKQLEFRDGHWRLVKIIHKVFGSIHVERF
jgi:hypothetical protein